MTQCNNQQLSQPRAYLLLNPCTYLAGPDLLISLHAKQGHDPVRVPQRAQQQRRQQRRQRQLRDGPAGGGDDGAQQSGTAVGDRGVDGITGSEWRNHESDSIKNYFLAFLGEME